MPRKQKFKKEFNNENSDDIIEHIGIFKKISRGVKGLAHDAVGKKGIITKTGNFFKNPIKSLTDPIIDPIFDNIKDIAIKILEFVIPIIIIIIIGIGIVIGIIIFLIILGIILKNRSNKHN